MRRHIPRLLLIGALLSPSTPYALGLGDIRLNSALNQPFDAEIDLLSATAEELSSLQVGLANAETFTRYGLDRPAFLASFTFRVTRAADGRTVLRVVSSPSVTEPFVTLLVEASWSRGRLLREYTVLLDPPVFTPGSTTAAAPVAAPRAGAPAGGAIERPLAPAPAQPDQPVAPAQQTQSASIGDSHRVQRNETLWQIASRIRPGSIRVINQTMIALYRANPAAFESNINELRAGSLLRVPTSGEIEAIAQTQAAAEVAEQYRSWRGAVGAAPQEGGRLRLVIPTESSGSPSTGTPPAGNPEGLRQQVATLEGRLAEAQRLLDLKNAELADMQRRLGQRAEPAAPAAPTAPEAPAPQLAPAEPAAAAAAEPAAATPPPAAEPPVQQPAKSVRAAKPEPEPSILDLLAQYWWALAGLGVALVAGLALYFRSRRSVDIDEAVEMTPTDFGSGIMTSPHWARPRARESAFVVEEGGDANDTAEIQSIRKPASAGALRSVEAAAAVATTADDTLSSETAVHFDQQDALAEADFHMAYGLYDQAADLVKIAIERQPDRRDLRLKLLEIFFVWGNKELFLDSARHLYETRDAAEPGEWDKIRIMGRQISPDDAMFQGDAGMPLSTDVVDLNLEGGENRVDMDLFGPDAGEEGKLDMDFTDGDASKGEWSSSDSGIDFLLDEPRRGADEDPTREIDSNARTQETPTIESPYLADRASQTIREQVDKQAIARVSSGVDQTAELSLDDLGLDVSSFEDTGSTLETEALDQTGERPMGGFDLGQNIDDDATRLADHSFIGSYDRTVESPRPSGLREEGTGTVVLRESDSDTVERPRAYVGATARMKAVDFDLDSLSGELDAGLVGDTVKRDGAPAALLDDFSGDVFGPGGTAEVKQLDEVSLDLDVGGFAEETDREPTKTEFITSMMDMPELEPVTMSEVGTKLDLARAYMDMGDPDGARSILEEVLQEGSTNQKQEAERLLDSIR